MSIRFFSTFGRVLSSRSILAAALPLITTAFSASNARATISDFDANTTSPAIAVADSLSIELSFVDVPGSTSAGDTTEILIAVRNTQNLPYPGLADFISVTIRGTNDTTSVRSIIENEDGTYSTSYVPTTAGTDTVTVAVFGEFGINGSGSPITVRPGRVSIDDSYMVVPDSLIAGQTAGVLVHLSDRYGNLVTDEFASIDLEVSGGNEGPFYTIELIDDGPDSGRYHIAYTPTVAGTDEITVRLRSEAIPALSGNALVVLADAPDVTATTASFNPNTVAGDSLPVTITVRDQYANPVPGVSGLLVFEVSTLPGTPLYPITETAPGVYQTGFTPRRMGSETLVIQLDGTEITGSPFSLNVAPGALSQDSSWVDVPKTAHVFSQVEIEIQAVDGNGNFIPNLELEFALQISGVNAGAKPESVNYASGRYILGYTPTAVGEDTVSIALDGVALGAPSVMQVRAGAVSPAASHAVIPDLERAGSRVEVLAHIADAYGNRLTHLADSIGIVITGGNQDITDFDVVLIDDGPNSGRYTISYTPIVAGPDEVTVTVNGQPIPALYGNVMTVLPDIPVGASSSASFNPFEVAGSRTTITVIPRDTYGNPVPGVSELIEVRVFGTNRMGTLSEPITEIDPGTYQTGYTPLKVGVDTIAVLVSNQFIDGNPFPLEIRAGAVSHDSSHVSVPAVGKVFVRSEIEIRIVDGNGNVLPDLESRLGLEVTGPNAGAIPDTISWDEGGLYILRYTPTAIGEDSITITLDGTPLDDPKISKVSPGDASQIASVVDRLTGTVSDALADEFVVEVTDIHGNPVGGVDVTFTITDVPADAVGHSLSQDGPVTTSADGLASIRLTAGSRPGVYTVTATVAGLAGSPITLEAEINAGAEPGSPTSLTVDPGDGTVTVRWSRPSSTGDSPVTGYEVAYSQDGGTTWIPIHDRVPTETSVTVDGLLNNHPYRFRVAAINAAGRGRFAEIIAIPVTPVTDDQDRLPEANPGEAIILTDGNPQPVTTEVVQDTILRVNGGDFSFSMSSVDSAGQARWLPSTGAVIRVEPHSYLRVFGHGFAPGTTVNVWMFSTPVHLGHVFVGPDGSFSGTVPIFANIPVGPHTIQANGLDASMEERSVALGIEVAQVVEPVSVPEVPGDVSVTAGDRQVDLTWSPPLDDGGLPVQYQVEYSTDDGTTWVAYPLDDATATSVTVTGLTNGSSYVFRVRAVNEFGPGPFSGATMSVTPTAEGSALEVALEIDEADLQPQLGDTIEIVVRVSNHGSEAETNVVVSTAFEGIFEDLVISGHFELIEASASRGEYDADRSIWSIETLAPYSSETLMLHVLVIEPSTDMEDVEE